nr:hypothetical protein [Tanacetum cinerariifolium]
MTQLYLVLLCKTEVQQIRLVQCTVLLQIKCNREEKPFVEVDGQSSQYEHEYINLDDETILTQDTNEETVASWLMVTEQPFSTMKDEMFVYMMKTANLLFEMIIPPPRTALDIAYGIYKCLKEWEIEGKIFSISVDNAAYNDKVVSDTLDQMFKEYVEMHDAMVRDPQVIKVDLVEGTPIRDQMKTRLDQNGKNLGIFIKVVAAYSSLRFPWSGSFVVS